MDNSLETMRKMTDEEITLKYLTFQIANQIYGIPIDTVIEIVQILPVTELPELPYYAKGIINLRGQVIPLIDLNLRFGKQEREYTDRTCIIIVDVEGVQIGWIVEVVNEVLDIKNSQITPKPSLFEEASSRYITNIAKTDKHVVLLLNAGVLVTEMDMEA